MKTNFTKGQKITMVAVIGVGLFNPMSIVVLQPYFLQFYTGVFLLCSAWVTGFLLVKALKPEKVNVPKKTAHTKKQVYQET